MEAAGRQAVATLANTVRQVRGLYSTVDASHADIASNEVNVQKARADVAASFVAAVGPIRQTAPGELPRRDSTACPHTHASGT